MRIAGLPPVLQQALLATLPKASEAFGASVTQAEAQHPQAMPPAVPNPATSVQMLVALAAAEPVAERRRRIAEHADKGLTMLERLHAELVVGTPSPERLQELVEWSESFEPPEDAEVAIVSREIELRVRVELAKLEMRV